MRCHLLKVMMGVSLFWFGRNGLKLPRLEVFIATPCLQHTPGHGSVRWPWQLTIYKCLFDPRGASRLVAYFISEWYNNDYESLKQWRNIINETDKNWMSKHTHIFSDHQHFSLKQNLFGMNMFFGFFRHLKRLASWSDINNLSPQVPKMIFWWCVWYINHCIHLQSLCACQWNVNI